MAWKDMSKKSRYWIIGIGVFFGLGVLGSLLPQEESTSTPTATAPVADVGAVDAGTDEAPVVADPPEASGSGIGNSVDDGQFRFTVTKIDCGNASVGKGIMQEDAQGQYCLVNMTVENIGEEAQTFDSSSQYLYDTQDRKFDSDTGASLSMEDLGNSFLNEINPGNSVDGVVVFDIPVDATPARLELHDSPFSDGHDVTL